MRKIYRDSWCSNAFYPFRDVGVLIVEPILFNGDLSIILNARQNSPFQSYGKTSLSFSIISWGMEKMKELAPYSFTDIWLYASLTYMCFGGTMPSFVIFPCIFRLFSVLFSFPDPIYFRSCRDSSCLLSWLSVCLVVSVWAPVWHCFVFHYTHGVKKRKPWFKVVKVRD